MPGGFVLTGNHGGRKALDAGVTPPDALAQALDLSLTRSCRVMLTRDGMTLAACERGQLIDPSMADFPESRPAKKSRA